MHSHNVLIFLGVKEGRKGSTAAAVLTIGNHLRILFFNFIVCVGLVFYLKCMIAQDEVDIRKVSHQIYHIVIFVYCGSIKEFSTHATY